MGKGEIGRGKGKQKDDEEKEAEEEVGTWGKKRNRRRVGEKLG